jgi:hypothetical protein
VRKRKHNASALEPWPPRATSLTWVSNSRVVGFLRLGRSPYKASGLSVWPESTPPVSCGERMDPLVGGRCACADGEICAMLGVETGGYDGSTALGCARGEQCDARRE